MSTSAAEIASVDAARYAAMVAGDGEALAAFLDEELVYTHSDGSRDTYASYLEKVRTGHFDYHRIDAPVDDTVLFGDCAIVVGRMEADVVVRGEARKLHNASLAVYRRKDGAWRLIAYQPTPMPR